MLHSIIQFQVLYYVLFGLTGNLATSFALTNLKYMSKVRLFGYAMMSIVVFTSRPAQRRSSYVLSTCARAVLSRESQSISGPNYVTVDRNLAMELVRVTEVSCHTVKDRAEFSVLLDRICHPLSSTPALQHSCRS